MDGRLVAERRFHAADRVRVGIALCTFTAFACLFLDAPVLVGPDGLEPIAHTLRAVANRSDHPMLALPTLFWWLPTNDPALRTAAGIGAAASVALLVPSITRFVAPFLAMLYLSFVNAGGAFFTFQWDALIVESLTLSVLLSPRPGRAARLAFWALNIKLYLESGLAKVLWSDDWTSLTAMGNYWRTAPLPTPLAWWMDRAPEIAQRAFTAGTLLGELAAPFLMFGGKYGRRCFAVIGISMQLSILATANYGAFNYLSIALALALIWEAEAGEHTARWEWGVAGGWALLSVAVGLSRFAGVDSPLATFADRWNVANAYHLFARIDPERDEVEFIGSADGQSWTVLPLAYKPAEAMAFIAPYHPRVAFSAWFWTLGERDSPLGFRVRSPAWGSRLVQRWCDSPEILVPILTRPVSAPRYVTLEFWRATFSTDRATWTRLDLGRYPAVHDCHDGGAPHFPQVEALAPADAGLR